MKKKLYSICLGILIALPYSHLKAWDWGLLLDQTAGLESVAGGEVIDGFSYSGTFIPWFQSPLGESGKLYISAGTTFEYNNGKPFFIPELLRTELSFRFGNNRELKAGRILYNDPLGFIASGLFDGARLSLDTGLGTMGFGLWYTGLLYKKNVQITMTGYDLAAFNEDLDYSNFMDTYFSSRRLMAAVDWDIPDLREWLRLKMALIAQFDLNGRDEKYHSQYLAARASMPYNNFIFDLGGSLELAEITGAVQKFKIGLAGELGIAWMLPTSIKDRLSFTARLSSGVLNDDSAFAAFVPITTALQGDVLNAKLSGLSMLRLNYSVLLHETLSFSLASSYFILNDLATYKGLPAGRDGHLLGNEFSGSLIWSPLSDLRLTLGGGVFLPAMGNAGGDTIWRINMNAVLVIF